MRSTRVPLAVFLGLSFMSFGLANAQGQPPELVGMTHVKTIKPMTGFIDDPFAFDGAGGRLLYVNADTGYMAELVVLDLSQGMVELKRIDISKFTTTPTLVRFVDQGYFVISRAPDADEEVAAVVDGQGQVVRKFGPATDVSLVQRDGKALVTLYKRSEKKPRKRGKSQAQVVHSVEALSLDTGKRVGKKGSLTADAKGRVKELEFSIEHFERGYTRVVGIKDGTWDAKENQRSPDHEAWYDMLTGVFEKRIERKDLMAHARLMQVRGKHQNQDEFLAAADDRSSLDLVDHQTRRKVELAEPFSHYDPSSLVQQPSEDGLFLFSLTIDPVHKEAAARKKADPEYMDLYVYRSGEAKAKRLARYLLDDKKKRTLSWRATEEYWIMVPRLIGFSRGGKELQIYAIDRK